MRRLLWSVGEAMALVLGNLAATDSYAQQGAIYEEPGLYKNRSYVAYHPNETIDPFTGRLQLHHVDVFIPGNGGLDLKIQRSYNNLQVVQGPPPVSGIVGLGWDLHFGRLRYGSNGSCSPAYWGGAVGQNPVLTLPDGSSHVVYATVSPYPGAMTKGWWKAECAPSPAIGMWVTSPDGIRYEMTQADGSGGFATRRISDRNGNTIDFTFTTQFDGEAVVTGISTSDGRSVTLNYGSSGVGGRSRLNSITAQGRTYTFSYQPLGGSFGNAYFQLSSVSGPEGLRWSYAYFGSRSNVGGSYSLQTATLPYGGTLTYDYAWKTFTPTLGALPVTVVSRKTTSDGGSWTFNYTPSQSQGTLDTTTMAGPEGTTTWKHFGYNTITNGEVWKLGLLAEKTVGASSIHREVYAWDKKQVSPQTDFRAPPYAGKSDVGAFVPLLVSRQIVRDGTAYTTNYPIGSQDAYGNPTSISETGQASRSTAQTFYINTSKWIVKQLANQTISGVGTITRSFDANGNPYIETRFGVGTTFGVDGDGNITSIRDARGMTRNFLSYSRGVPRSETHPEGVNISRIVDGVGNVTSETDGENKTTLYGYDLLSRITSVNPPANNTSTITWSFASRTKTVARGPLVETTTFDSFGRPIRINRGSVVRTIEYDPLGRKTFESYPGSSFGTSYQFDILGRVTRIGHGDGSARTTTRLANNQEREVDERNLTTTRTFRSYGDPDARELTSIDTPQAGADVTIGRNGHGDITSLSQNGITRTYSYNSSFFLVGVTEPEVGTTTLGRDAVGNMTSRRVGSSGTTTYTIDGLNRVESIDYPGATPSVTKTYDRRSRVKRVASAATAAIPAIARDLDYDANGNLLVDQITVGGSSRQLGFAYDGNDNLSAITYPSGMTVSYVPDVLGRPTKALPHVTAAAHYDSGNLSSMTMANNVSTTFTESPNRQWPTGISVPWGGIMGMSYVYDPQGNPTSITDSRNSANSRTLAYDSIGRLTSASGPWTSGTINYNGSGDLTSQFFSGVNIGYGYVSSRLSTVTVGAQPTRSLTYDAYGNVTGNGLHSFRYNEAQALDCIDCALPGKIEYAYDGEGHMVRALEGGVETFYMYGIDGRLYGEYVPGQANLKREHVYLGGKRVATRKTVTEVASATTLSVATSPSVFGQPLTLTAIVSGLSPTGNIAFKNGGTPIAGCESRPLSSGSAECVADGLPVGTHSLSAAYGGDEFNLASTSAPASAVVNKAASSTSIVTVTPNPATVGQSVTVTTGIAAVAPGAGAPSGTVTVSSGGGPSCQATLPATSCVLVFPTSGTKSITASYAGDTRFLASATATGSDVVINEGLPTTTTLSISTSPTVFGQALTLTASVAGSSPAGSVAFKDGASLIAGCEARPLNSGSATCITAALGVGTHSLVAAYLGGGQNLPSESAPGTAEVNKASSATTITGTVPNPASVGQGMSVTVSVGALAPGFGSPGGTVTVSAADGPSCQVLLPATSCTLVFPTPGPKSVTASYAGDAQFLPSASEATSGRVMTSGVFRDFNGDGRSDILWRRNDGFMYQWFMNGAAILATGSPGMPSSEWVVEAMGDISGDGKADIVWRNTVTGELSIWALSGATVTDSQDYGVVDPAWKVEEVADMDGDGYGDLLLRHATAGTTVVWTMAGIHAPTGFGLGDVDPEWSLAAAGDLNGDGSSDILWRHSSGWMAVWFSTGFPGFVGADFGLLDPPWKVAGLGDYNLDGAMDIVLRHEVSGDVFLFLTGPGGTWEGSAVGARSLDWSIMGVGDYDGDGRSDLLWRQASTGTVSLWRFISPSTFETQDIGPVGAEWTLVNP